MKEHTNQQKNSAPLYYKPFKHITDNYVGNPYTFKKGISFTPSNKPKVRPRKRKNSIVHENKKNKKIT